MSRLWSFFKRRETTAKLKAIEHSFAVIEFDLDGRILAANENYLALMGYTLAEVLGQHHAMFVGATVRETPEYRAFWQALNRGEFRTAEFRKLSKDGREVWMQATYAPILNLKRKPYKVMNVALDITSRVELERDRVNYERKLESKNDELERLAQNLDRARNQADEANRAKSRFLAGMSHELRTPLNGILGYAQLLRIEGGLTAMQATRVHAMLRAGGHLLEMINCVLDLSEIETERVELQMVPVEMRNIVGACMDLVLPAADFKRIGLTFTIAADVPRRVIADRTRVRQVLLNLLGNAVKFTPQGAVELRLLTSASGTQLRFEVADTGPGIPPDQRHRLFQAFDRLDDEATRNIEGTGLGLALSARLTMIMHGTLAYQDNPGGGSIFCLELPLVAVDDAVPAESHPSATIAPEAEPDLAPACTLRVLVVDDVAMNRDIAAAFLRSAGHTVTSVEGGEDAVAQATAEDFDVIMMDLRMPGVDGLEATRRIRALSTPRGQVPIVALTAQVFSEQVEECRVAGMDEYLVKPFTLAALLEALARGVNAGQRHRHDLAEPAADDAAESPSVSHAIPGSDLPIINQGAFDQTVALLNNVAVQSYLMALADRAKGLRLALQTLGEVALPTTEHAELAHALVGSAGLFGYERFVAIGRQFEHAARIGSVDVAELTEELKVVLDDTLENLAARIGPAKDHAPGAQSIRASA